MTGWLPGDAPTWGGQPVARTVRAAAARRRAVLCGTVAACRVVRLGAGPAFDALLDDGTGSITLRWLGRRSVPGVARGSALRVEGTVSAARGRLLVLNPLYRFDRLTPR